MAKPKIEDFAAETLEQELTDRHGPMISGEALRAALGYPSNESFRQAFVRKLVPVPVFTLERRRGKFALTKDVAAWLISQRKRAIADSTEQLNEGGIP